MAEKTEPVLIVDKDIKKKKLQERKAREESNKVVKEEIKEFAIRMANNSTKIKYIKETTQANGIIKRKLVGLKKNGKFLFGENNVLATNKKRNK